MAGGGGHRRIRELYRHAASEGLEITLLCFADAGRCNTVIAPHFRQIAVPKTSDHLALQLSVDALYDASAADVVALVCCGSNDALGFEFRAALATAEAVVFEHVYMAPLAALVPAGIPIVYSAQNVESLLKERVLASHPHAQDLVEAVQLAETSLIDRATVIVCVSREDAAEFRAVCDKPIHVVENGVTFWSSSQATERRGVLFIGSGHPPNVEAAEFILSRVAPALPEVPFYIVGSVSDKVSGGFVPLNVTLFGVIDTTRKIDLLQSAAIGLNPMFSGSGSNLKLPEYFAARLPVISTSFGARGFDVANGVHLRIAEPEQFAGAIRELLADPEMCLRMTERAYEYAWRQLSWSALGARMGHVLLDLLSGERVLKISEEPDGIAVDSGVRFPVGVRYLPELREKRKNRDVASIVGCVQSHEFDAEDSALRSCTPACPDLERFLSLYGHLADRVVLSGGPRSSVRRATRLLQIAGVPTFLRPVFDAEAIEDHWLGWYDALTSATVVDADAACQAVLDELDKRGSLDAIE
jgi:hypothetical protein